MYTRRGRLAAFSDLCSHDPGQVLCRFGYLMGSEDLPCHKGARKLSLDADLLVLQGTVSLSYVSCSHFLALGAGWEQSRGCQGLTCLSLSPATFTCQSSLSVCADDVPLPIETRVSWSACTGLPPLLPSPLPAWPLGCHHCTQATGHAVLSWLSVAPLPVGPTQDYIKGNGIVGSLNPYLVWRVTFFSSETGVY